VLGIPAQYIETGYSATANGICLAFPTLSLFCKDVNHKVYSFTLDSKSSYQYTFLHHASWMQYQWFCLHYIPPSCDMCSIEILLFHHRTNNCCHIFLLSIHDIDINHFQVFCMCVSFDSFIKYIFTCKDYFSKSPGQ